MKGYQMFMFSAVVTAASALRLKPEVMEPEDLQLAAMDNAIAEAPGMSKGTMGALAFVALALTTLVTHEKPWWKLDQSFDFYASYHQDTINKIIHFFCIWPIFATFMPIFGYTDTIVPFVPYGNVSFIIAVVYAVYYMFLCRKDAPVIGALSAGLVVACWYGGNHYAAITDQDVVFKQAIIVNIICWIAQFIGHGVFEGKRPALFQNLGQSLVMAPLFVFIELAVDLNIVPELGKRLQYTKDMEKIAKGEKVA